MLAGFATHLAMYGAGIIANGSFFVPVRIFNLDPILVGLAVSFTCTYLVTRITPPPPDDIVTTYFCKGE